MQQQVPQFGKNEGLARQLTRLFTTRYAKYQRLPQNTGTGARHNGGRIDFSITQLRKERAEGGEFFGE